MQLTQPVMVRLVAPVQTTLKINFRIFVKSELWRSLYICGHMDEQMQNMMRACACCCCAAARCLGSALPSAQQSTALQQSVVQRGTERGELFAGQKATYSSHRILR